MTPNQTRRELLEALQERLHAAIFDDDRTQPRDLSALVARLLDVSKALEDDQARADEDAARTTTHQPASEDVVPFNPAEELGRGSVPFNPATDI